MGAPLDQNRQPGTNRSGALWQCPLTTNTGDCKQVITDGRLSESINYYKLHVKKIIIGVFIDSRKHRISL